MQKKFVKNWQKFDGDCEKQPCYVRLTDSNEYGPCYPNADTFHSLTREFSTPINAEYVTHIAYVDWDVYLDWFDQVRREDEALQGQA